MIFIIVIWGIMFHTLFVISSAWEKSLMINHESPLTSPLLKGGWARLNINLKLTLFLQREWHALTGDSSLTIIHFSLTVIVESFRYNQYVHKITTNKKTQNFFWVFINFSLSFWIQLLSLWDWISAWDLFSYLARLLWHF